MQNKPYSPFDASKVSTDSVIGRNRRPIENNVLSQVCGHCKLSWPFARYGKKRKRTGLNHEEGVVGCGQHLPTLSEICGKGSSSDSQYASAVTTSRRHTSRDVTGTIYELMVNFANNL